MCNAIFLDEHAIVGDNVVGDFDGAEVLGESEGRVVVGDFDGVRDGDLDGREELGD